MKTFIYLLLLYICIKDLYTLAIRSRIFDAIHDYNVNAGRKHRRLIKYSIVESYWASVFRLWDWRWSSIVPRRYFVRIKPYL